MKIQYLFIQQTDVSDRDTIEELHRSLQMYLLSVFRTDFY